MSKTIILISLLILTFSCSSQHICEQKEKSCISISSKQNNSKIVKVELTHPEVEEVELTYPEVEEVELTHPEVEEVHDSKGKP